MSKPSCPRGFRPKANAVVLERLWNSPSTGRSTPLSGHETPPTFRCECGRPMEFDPFGTFRWDSTRLEFGTVGQEAHDDPPATPYRCRALFLVQPQCFDSDPGAMLGRR